MVRIRLTRMGRKKAPYYRLVVQDGRRARDGRFIEIIGRYQPINPDESKRLEIKEDLALKWLLNGAQPTDTVRSLFRKLGIMKKFQEERVARKKAVKEGKGEG